MKQKDGHRDKRVLAEQRNHLIVTRVQQNPDFNICFNGVTSRPIETRGPYELHQPLPLGGVKAALGSIILAGFLIFQNSSDRLRMFNCYQEAFLMI